MAVNKFRLQLASRIKKIRVNLGYSQEEVAKKLGVHRPTISMIESSEREVSAEEIVKLAIIFGVAAEDLLREVPVERAENRGEYQITCYRHGEAVDDVYDQYGGWADPELSPRGINKAYAIATSLKNRGIRYQAIYTSPLRRARQLAEIMGSETGSDVKVVQYLKERNTYGLLCGINKTIAKKRFPDLVEAYESGQYVWGSERSEDFESRIPSIFEYIRRRGKTEVAAVTHGKVMTAILKYTLGMTAQALEEGCMVKLGMEADKFYLIASEGVIFAKHK